MSPEDLVSELGRRAGRDWELYRKTAESRELFATQDSRTLVVRREEGWAGRWWEEGAPRFASGSGPAEVAIAIQDSGRVAVAASPSPDWPTGRNTPEEAPLALATPPPDLFEALARLVSAESHGAALLSELSTRRGMTAERIANGRGLDVTMSGKRLDGTAVAIGRQGARSCEGRVIFRWDGEPDLEALARRLSDRATLPLSERTTPVSRGEWLLDPSVSAAILSAIAPLFCGETPPRWVHRAELFSKPVTIVDDASADAPFDGEGAPTRRVVLVDAGAWRQELRDLASAKRTGKPVTGHGVRPSYRVPPSVAPRRLFFETSGASSPRELLISVRRGLFASALTAPLRFELEQDRYEAEFTGVAIVAGRALGPVAGARASGRISELLRRIASLGSDRQFFPMPYPVGAPTLFVERASFD